jgi:transcriptional regulator with XRE-family HTH domain
LDSKQLGFRIRQAREQRGLSQEEFAAAVSKDQGAISDYENGKRKLAAIDLPLFAIVLEVPLLYFFEEDASIYNLDEVLLNYFHQLPDPNAQQGVIEIIRTLSKMLGQDQ